MEFSKVLFGGSVMSNSINEKKYIYILLVIRGGGGVKEGLTNVKLFLRLP